ncbi:hypothetical protein CONCODRAFT_67698 [Conidiobolus coronatus NRRL 28638]|uniref:DUF4097 domain-containing protein n=1 Tax=Conidiobolus coronatus (strain ATCC 28846 / CBS 209.66 / NRRL 28638) TaxID=796925 RepID=A0A137PH10_CONC2|nr:hypothetical protein CONCODRAFT_67698 [Conidiobolus coronatus NRRL 28638]|eukprot:KXN74255.1 hypothetical protein CONCODRAFT_67698 [Conidiobolus coronatus NRRL 28638]
MPTTSSKKCHKRSLSSLVYVYFYGFNNPFYFDKYYSNKVNGVHPPRHEECKPTIDWVESSESFDPKDITGLGVFFKGSVASPKVSFKRKDQTNVTIDYVIKASSETAGRKAELHARANKEFYHWSVRGPTSWHHRSNYCISAEVVVTLPSSLKDFGKLIIAARTSTNPDISDFNLDFGSELNLEKLRIHAPKADLSLKGQKVNHLSIEVASGNLEISDIQASEIKLKARHGSIRATKVSAPKFSADGTDTIISASLKSSENAIVHTLNSNVELEIESFDPLDASRAEFKAITVNGDASLKVPASFLGRFSSKTLNGNAELQVDGNNDNVHVKFNSTHHVSGYKGEVEKSGSFSEAITFNGDTNLHFF